MPAHSELARTENDMSSCEVSKVVVRVSGDAQYLKYRRTVKMLGRSKPAKLNIQSGMEKPGY